MRKLGRRIMEHHAIQVLRSVINNLDRHDAPRAASAIAFDAFLSLIPLIAIAGHVLTRLHQTSELLLDPLLRAAPPGVAPAMSAEFQRMAESSVVAPLAVIGFIWVSSAGLSTAMGVFETIYGCRARPWYIRRTIAAGCVLGSLAVVPAVAAIGVVIATVSGSLGAQLIALTLPAAMLILLVSAFFRIAIAERPGLRRPVIPGAAL
ncbi:MAG TPA: YhjD/YihY/BrkB family envelope integrity protein, partial [Candidatus Nanopelagicales bacterium]|nr:YhjD/YihY/BrkB family envelope integrity protein [Candidatus Nanopelagicales bacterium]